MTWKDRSELSPEAKKLLLICGAAFVLALGGIVFLIVSTSGGDDSPDVIRRQPTDAEDKFEVIGDIEEDENLTDEQRAALEKMKEKGHTNTERVKFKGRSTEMEIIRDKPSTAEPPLQGGIPFGQGGPDDDPVPDDPGGPK